MLPPPALLMYMREQRKERKKHARSAAGGLETVGARSLLALTMKSAAREGLARPRAPAEIHRSSSSSAAAPPINPVKFSRLEVSRVLSLSLTRPRRRAERAALST